MSRKAGQQQFLLEQQSEAVMQLLHYRSHKGEDREAGREKGESRKQVWGEGLKTGYV